MPGLAVCPDIEPLRHQAKDRRRAARTAIPTWRGPRLW
jgi:hypothetical protein